MIPLAPAAGLQRAFKAELQHTGDFAVFADGHLNDLGFVSFDLRVRQLVVTELTSVVKGGSAGSWRTAPCGPLDERRRRRDASYFHLVVSISDKGFKARAVNQGPVHGYPHGSHIKLVQQLLPL